MEKPFFKSGDWVIAKNDCFVARILHHPGAIGRIKYRDVPKSFLVLVEFYLGEIGSNESSIIYEVDLNLISAKFKKI